MKFWDTSAIMPLIAEEETSEAVSALFATDSDIVLSWFTPVEISSAIWRRWRETTEVLQRERAERVVSRLRESWYEVTDIHAVAQLAHEVLQRHRLKAADALQLASALAVANDRNLVPFVTLDGRLAAAAQGEGVDRDQADHSLTSSQDVLPPYGFPIDATNFVQTSSSFALVAAGGW